MPGLLVLKVFIGAATGAIAAMIAMALYRAREPVAQDVVFSEGYAVRRFWLAIVLAVAVAAFVISIPDFPYPSAATTGHTYTIVAQQYDFAPAGYRAGRYAGGLRGNLA